MKNMGQQRMSHAKEIFPRAILGWRALSFASPGLQDAKK